jgi:preprotein translocase subunit SecB
VPAKKTSPSRRDQQYASFLKGIRLLGFGLQESHTAQNRTLYAELYEKSRLARRISTEYRTVEVEKEFFNATAKLTLTVEDKKGPAPPAVIVECTYMAHFHCDGCQITRELAERFTESELRLVVWPYFRQFVNDATAKMTIDPILIPFSALS